MKNIFLSGETFDNMLDAHVKMILSTLEDDVTEISPLIVCSLATSHMGNNIVLVRVQFIDDHQKKMVASHVAKMIAQNGLIINAVWIISEAWMTTVKNGDTSDREEVIAISGSTIEGGKNGAVIHVYRDENDNMAVRETEVYKLGGGGEIEIETILVDYFLEVYAEEILTGEKKNAIFN